MKQLPKKLKDRLSVPLDKLGLPLVVRIYCYVEGLFYLGDLYTFAWGSFDRNDSNVNRIREEALRVVETLLVQENLPPLESLNLICYGWRSQSRWGDSSNQILAREREAILATDVDALPVTVRALHGLRNAGFKTIGEIPQRLTRHDIMKIHNCGPKVAANIDEVLGKLGLQLKGETVTA